MSETVYPFTELSSDSSRPGPRATPLRRDEATVDSDVDVLVEQVGPVGWTELAQAEDYLEVLFGARVDFVFWDTLKPRVRPYIARDLLRVA